MDPYAYVSFFARESLVEQRRKSDGLSAVRAAMANVYPGCRRIEFDVDQADLVVDLGGGALPFGQLSDGQRSLVGFVLSLAIRAFQLNPQLGPDAPTQTPGLVLIDEIDLHLHPTWQRDILSGLQRAFPHMSFIVTTHSPIVLTEVAASSIVDLDQLTSSTTSHAESLKVSTLGKQAGWVLDHVMGAENRSAEITEKLNLLDRLIADASLDAAEALLLELRQILDDDEPALVGPTWELADAKQHAQNR